MRGINYIYDIAYELESDLQNLSESLNKSATAPLIHKIVNVLEELERHSQLYETKRKEIDQLKTTIKRLEDDKIHREQEKQIHEKDLESLDKTWHSQSMELMKNIEKLQEDNANISAMIKQACSTKRFNKSLRLNQQFEIKSIHLKLKETIDNQVEEAKVLRKELAQRCIDFDAMQQECLNLSKINTEICENHCKNKMISRKLMEEKANIEAQILINNKSINRHSIKRNRVVQNNNDDVFVEDTDNVVDSDETDSSGVNFSWEEMKDYLQDCNRLKSEVNVKEEELMVYRPNRFDDEEVQGPINKEPQEKMSPSFCQESGIRKYFQNLIVAIKI